jgi:extracellular matrix protein 14
MTTYHDGYHQLVNVSAFMDSLAKDWPDVCQKVTIGKSAEGRDIEGLKIHRVNGTQTDNSVKSRRKWMRWTERFSVQHTVDEDDGDKVEEFFLMGGQHGREVSPLMTPAYRRLNSSMISFSYSGLLLLQSSTLPIASFSTRKPTARSGV